MHKERRANNVAPNFFRRYLIAWTDKPNIRHGKVKETLEKKCILAWANWEAFLERNSFLSSLYVTTAQTISKKYDPCHTRMLAFSKSWGRGDTFSNPLSQQQAFVSKSNYLYFETDIFFLLSSFRYPLPWRSRLTIWTNWWRVWRRTKWRNSQKSIQMYVRKKVKQTISQIFPAVLASWTKQTAVPEVNLHLDAGIKSKRTNQRNIQGQMDPVFKTKNFIYIYLWKGGGKRER